MDYYSIEVSLKLFHVLNQMTVAFKVHEFLKNRISKSAPFWTKTFPSITTSINYNYYNLNFEIVYYITNTITGLSITITITITSVLNYLLP